MVIKMNVGGEHLWGGLWGYDLSSPESRCTCHQYHRHNNQMVKMKIFYQRSESAPKIFRFSLQSMKSRLYKPFRNRDLCMHSNILENKIFTRKFGV